MTRLAIMLLSALLSLIIGPWGDRQWHRRDESTS